MFLVGDHLRPLIEETKTVNQRIDIPFPGGILTRKSQPNGEIRTRLKFDGGYVTTVTEIGKWNWWDGAPPWQEGHSHRGLSEVYFVLEGWVVVVKGSDITGDRYIANVVGVGESVHFHPGEEHFVLPGPLSVFQTMILGTPEGNPEKAGNDWWPALAEHQAGLRSFDEDAFERAKSFKKVLRENLRPS